MLLNGELKYRYYQANALYTHIQNLHEALIYIPAAGNDKDNCNWNYWNHSSYDVANAILSFWWHCCRN